MKLQIKKHFMVFFFWLNFLVPVFGFPQCIFHSFYGRRDYPLFEFHGTNQIRAPIIHPSSGGVVERNMQLVIIQVRKWVLNQGPGAKTIWGRSIPDIMPLINDRLVRLHGFISAKTMLGFVTDWKAMNGSNARADRRDLTKGYRRDGRGAGRIEELETWF